MKQKMMILMAVVLMMVNIVPVMASEEVLDLELEGYVTQIVEDGFIMEDKDLGEVLLNVSEATVFDGMLMEYPIELYDYVVVQYDGMLTRSIPAQAHADVVSRYMVEGFVAEIMEDAFLLTGDTLHGEVIVNMTEDMPTVMLGAPVLVFFDGIMTMSLPGQITAREIITAEMSGEIESLTDDGFTLFTEDGKTLMVTYSEETTLEEMVFDREMIMDVEGMVEGDQPVAEIAEDGDADILSETPSDLEETDDDTIDEIITLEEGMTVYLYGIEWIEAEGDELSDDSEEVVTITVQHIVLKK